jgi:hypothetical protein
MGLPQSGGAQYFLFAKYGHPSPHWRSLRGQSAAMMSWYQLPKGEPELDVLIFATAIVIPMRRPIYILPDPNREPCDTAGLLNHPL